jgi:outer membrane protein assembly factor BamB
MSCPGREASRQRWRQTLVNCGLVALTTALVAAVLLIVSWRSSAPVRTVQAPVLAKALEAGRQATDDASAAAWAREMDQLARHAYFGSLRFQRRGVLLLVASLLTALGCFQTAVALDRSLPNPRLFAPPGGGRRRRLAWYAVSVALVLAAVVHHLLLLVPRAATPVDAGPVVAISLRARPPGETPPPPLADDVLARGWTRFRGPNGLGVAAATRVPVDWDFAVGRNVRWKVPLAQAGFSSPIIWEGRVFLTAADARERAVLAFDLATGAQVWRQTVPYGGGPLPLPAVSDDTGYAAPTMACDGMRVFALFGTGDLAAFTLAGEPVWRQHLGAASIDYGHASSPVLAGGLLVIAGDRAEGGVVKALDPATGAPRWALARDGIGPSWSTPVAIPDAGLLLHAPYVTTMHRVTDGRELWRVDAVGGEIAPSPAWDAGRFYVAQEYARVVAFAVAGTNAPTQLWEHLEHLPSVASPVAHDGRLWVVTQGGEAVCLDGTTGAPLWEHIFDEGFYASPIIAAGHLYLVDRRGTVHILETGRAFKPVATLPLGEPADATPAPGEGYLIFRTSESLLCVGEAPAPGE